MRRAMIIAVSIAVAIAASSAVSCTRVVELGLPDAGIGGFDGATDGGTSFGDASTSLDGDTSSDGGFDPDAGPFGDASIPDAP